MKDLIDQLLDSTIVFCFDRSGFRRHCPIPLERFDLSAKRAIVTGGSSGIGLAVAKALINQGMNCQIIARDIEKLQKSFFSKSVLSLAEYHSLDIADLKNLYFFAVNQVKDPIDLIVHNAGSMPNSLLITKDGFEQMFASQVLGPFILTKTLADLGKLKKGCRIIFVSSGGMYLQKLDLSNLLFEKSSYNKYTGYANAKRAQVILAELFSERYPEYLFSAMHPGWVDTPGVHFSMPFFTKLLNKRLRSVEEGADTILWLATTEDYPNGKFWFDRKERKTTILNFNKSSRAECDSLWKYCESVFYSIKGI